MATHGDDAPVLETERLTLRRLTVDDLDVLARMYSDVEVRRSFPEGTLDRDATHIDGTTLPLRAITRARWASARSGGNR
jgi:hypothetical protein